MQATWRSLSARLGAAEWRAAGPVKAAAVDVHEGARGVVQRGHVAAADGALPPGAGWRAVRAQNPQGAARSEREHSRARRGQPLCSRIHVSPSSDGPRNQRVPSGRLRR